MRKKSAQEKLDRFARLVEQHQQLHAQAPKELREKEHEIEEALGSLCRTDGFQQLAKYYYGDEQTCGDRLLLHIMAAKYREPTMLLEKHDRRLFMTHLDEQYSEDDDGTGVGPVPVRVAYYSTETHAYTGDVPEGGGSPQYQGPCYEYDGQSVGYRGPPVPRVSEAWPGPCAPLSPEYSHPSSPQYRAPRYRLTDEGTVEESDDDTVGV